MGNNTYNQIKDIITDIFERLHEERIREIEEQFDNDPTKSQESESDNQKFAVLSTKIAIACQTAKNHALNDFETTYKDCKIQLENL